MLGRKSLGCWGAKREAQPSPRGWERHLCRRVTSVETERVSGYKQVNSCGKSTTGNGKSLCKGPEAAKFSIGRTVQASVAKIK